MTKLSSLLEFLSTFKGITVHTTQSRVTRPAEGQVYEDHYQVVNIVTFPTTPLYTAKELDDFLREVIIGIDKRGDIHYAGFDSFVELSHEIQLGQIIFGEDIGRSVETIRINDPLMQNENGFKNGVKVIKKALHRVIHLRIFPDQVTAWLAYPTPELRLQGTPWNIYHNLIHKEVLQSIQDGETALKPAQARAA